MRYAARALVVGRRLAQLEPQTAHANRKGIGTGLTRAGVTAGGSALRDADVEAAVAVARERHRGVAYLDAKQAEAVAASRQELAQRIADRDSPRAQNGRRAAVDGNGLQHGGAAADADRAGAYGITRDAWNDLDCKAQQLVALRDHDPNHGCGGQQADCIALAHETLKTLYRPSPLGPRRVKQVLKQAYRQVTFPKPATNG